MKKPKTNAIGTTISQKHQLILDVTFERPLTRKQAKVQIDRVLEKGIPIPGTTINRITTKDAQRYIDGKANPLRAKLSRIKDSARAVELTVLDLKDTIEKD